MTRRTFYSIVVAGMGGAAARPVKGARMAASRAKRSVTGKAAAEEGSSAGPVVFTLTAEERWPIRGLDPVLYIGGVAIENYQFGNAENTVLIFTCYDASGLRDGADAFVRYGQDESSRTMLPNFTWANVK